MKSIDQHNINEWFFELVEGNLSASDKSQLYSFVEKNPQFQQELDLWLGTVYKDTDEMVLPNQDQLLRKESVLGWRIIMAGLALLITASGYLYFSNNETPIETNSKEEITVLEETLAKKEVSEKSEEMVIESEVNDPVTPESSVLDEVETIPNHSVVQQKSESIVVERTIYDIQNIAKKDMDWNDFVSKRSKRVNRVSRYKYKFNEYADEDLAKSKSEADIIEIQNIGF